MVEPRKNWRKESCRGDIASCEVCGEVAIRNCDREGNTCRICGKLVCTQCAYILQESKESDKAIYTKYTRQSVGRICKSHVEDEKVEVGR